jgi:glyoxylase-like metal-dependent hydrolase (beta-lactamase superfamily II)
MGYRSSAKKLIKDLSANGVGEDDLHYLLPTHVHLDHSGSCGTLARMFPNASVRVHPRGEPHLSDPTRLLKGAGEVFGESLMQKFGTPDPISSKRVHSVLDDEQIALGNGVTLRTVWTPGHAPHHLSYLLEETGALFTGDAVGVYSPAVPVLVPTSPPPSFNLEKAVGSLERLRGLSPVQLLTPHFGLLRNAGERLEENINALLGWKSKLERLLSCKSSVDEIVAVLTEEIREGRGRSAANLPEFIRTTIRVSVLGLLVYSEWNARQ